MLFLTIESALNLVSMGVSEKSFYLNLLLL